MNRIIFVFATLLAISVSPFCNKADAQSFLWHLKKAESGKGTISIHQDKSLDYLIDNREPVKATAKTDTVADKVKTAKTHRADTVRTQQQTPDAAIKRQIISKNDTAFHSVPSKKIITNGRKVQGYRIQLYAGGNTRKDRQKAESIGRKAKQYFPSEPIYTHFYSPRWICRMGNYESLDTATQMLRQVQQAGFSGACVVKGTITVKKTREIKEPAEYDE